MIARPRSGTWSALLLAAVASVACLPHAEPGVGEKVLSGRGMGDLTFAPPAAGEATPGTALLFSREIHQTAAQVDPFGFPRRDLFAFAPGEAEAQLLAEEFDYVRGLPLRQDRLGRLLLRHGGGPFNEGRLEASLFHPGSRRLEKMGHVLSVRLSPCGGWLTYHRAEGDLFARRVADDREFMLSRGALDAVVDGALVFLGADRRLQRIAPAGDAAEELANDVSHWRPLSGRATPAVLISRPVAMGRSQLSLLELTGTPPPPRAIGPPVLIQALVISSPDGGRVVAAEQAREDSSAPVKVTVMSLDDGAVWGRDLPVRSAGVGPSGRPNFRRPARLSVAFPPGSADVWIFVDGRLHVLSPGGSSIFVDRDVEPSMEIVAAGTDAAVARFSSNPVDRGVRGLSLFTADGRRWLFRDSERRIRLGDAADPTDEGGPIVALRDQFTETPPVIELPGGALLIVREVLGDRRDLHLLEPPWEASRQLLTGVGSVVPGMSRVLAVTRRFGGSAEGSGDLVLVDMATGEQTRLAQNVAAAALAPSCADCDPTAPGTTVAYVVQARVPFAFDGLWLGRLP